MNVLELNKNYLTPKVPMNLLGLNDSTWCDGVYARPYVEEYLSDGTPNPEYTDWRSKPFTQRGYKFLGDGNSLQWSLTREQIEIGFDTTVEKKFLNGKTSLQITFECGNKTDKKLASLGVSGMLLKKPQAVTDFALGGVDTPAVKKGGVSRNFVINSSVDVSTLLTKTGLKFAYDTTPVALTEVVSPETLADDTFFMDQKTNSFIVKLKGDTQKEGTLSLKYTGDIEDVIVGYGGESKESVPLNIVAIYNDKESGKVIFMEAFRCYLDGSRTTSFRPQNATDGGSTQPITFNGTEDVTRPAGQTLYIKKDDWDTSLAI